MALENNGHWYDKILNSWPAVIDPASIKSIGVAAGNTDSDGDFSIKPKVTGNNHQYYNSALFVRACWPPALYSQIRWSAKSLGTWPKWIPKIGGKEIPQFIQFGIGYKLNGRIGAHFRLQTDESNAAPQHPDAPNNGHANGWDFGGK